MFNPFRAIWDFVSRLFGSRKTTAPKAEVEVKRQFDERVENCPAEPERTVSQTVVNVYRATNEVAGSIMLPDKLEKCIEKLVSAKRKIGWALTHKKVVLAKVHGVFSSLWHAGAAWVAKATACLTAPGVIAAAVVVVVGAICILAMMHAGGAV